VFNVLDHGAVTGGARLSTKGLQSAVDACSQAGGGIVYFPPGVYLSGTIVLKPGVTLHLAPGSVLRGSPKLEDYPSHVPAMRSYTDNYTEKCLIYAENAHNVGIEGRGVIDGQGAAFKGPYNVRPYTMRFIGCRNVWISDIFIKDSPMWVQHYLGCENVSIRGIAVRSRVNHNNDGIDIDCCERVRISDCDIWSGDDAIVLKSTADKPCKDVVITNCVLSTVCNALKMGTETNGGFENIAISNCTIYDTRLAGIALEIVDGGVMDRVAISNITMNGVGAPIFLRLGDRARPFVEGGPRPAMGAMRNVTISGIEAVRCSRTGCAVAGLPGHPIENVTIENVRLSFAGGGAAGDAVQEVPENPDKYPEFHMFGKVLPAYGFYCRHLKDLKLRDIETRYEQKDGRPALIAEDVEGLELAGGSLAVEPDSGASVRLRQVKSAFLHGCRAASSSHAYVHATESSDVYLTGNDLRRASKEIESA
jgi:polygalacturonase